MIFKKTGLWMLGFVLAVGLAACSSGKKGEAQTDKPSEVITLSVLSEPPWSDGTTTLYRDFYVKEFEARNPGIKLEVQEVQDYMQVLTPQLVAGGGPDLLFITPTTVAEYAKAGYTLNLNDYIDEYKWDTRFHKWAYETGVIDGNLYGLPTEYEAMMVWYNKDMFASYGWKIPENYDEFKALCAEIAAAGKMPIAFGTSDYKPANEWVLSSIYNAALGEQNMRKLLSNEIPWTDPSVKDATQKWVDLWQAGYVSDKESFSITLDDAMSLFLSEEAAMKIEGSWALEQLISEASFDFDFFIMPPWAENKPAVPLALGTMAVNARTKYPDEAVKYLDWLSSYEMAEAKLKLIGAVFAMHDFDFDKVDGANPRFVDMYKRIQTYMEGQNGYASWTYWGPKVRAYTYDNIDSVFLGQLSVDQYLENANKEALKDEADGTLFNFE